MLYNHKTICLFWGCVILNTTVATDFSMICIVIWSIGITCLSHHNTDSWGGSRQKFGKVCAAQVFKNWFSGSDFFGLKLGSQEQIFAKICVTGANDLVKIGQNWSWNKIFSKNGSGVFGAGKGLEKVGLRS